MSSPAVVVRGLTAGYPGVLALSEVDLEVPTGEVTALLGANGSGKSTLFSTMLGLSAPRAGSVRLFGDPPQRARRRQRVSFVPQHDRIDTSFPITVEEVVLMGRYGRMGVTRRARPADHTAVSQALDRVRLADLRSRAIGELSGGQRRRAFLARALAQEAPLMLLDEPFAGVDRFSEDLIAQVLRQLRDEGVTVVLSTHRLESVETLADHVILLHQRVLATGRPAEILTAETLGRAFGAVLGGADTEDKTPPEGDHR